MIELEREFGPNRVTTEREMRAADTALGTVPARQPGFTVPLHGGRGQLQLTPVGRPRLHFPDCTVTGLDDEAGLIAIELERTTKGRARLRQIKPAYVAAHHIESVRYYVTAERVQALVQSETAHLHAGGLVCVRSRFELPATHTPSGATAMSAAS